MQQSKLILPKAEVHDIYYDGRGLNRDAIQELSTVQFLHNKTNVIFQGFTGSWENFPCLCSWKTGLQTADTDKVYTTP